MRQVTDLFPDAVLVERPLQHHKLGLQETASGYGSRLTSRYMIRLTPSDKRLRRVYITQYSNAGTAWIIANGEQFAVPDFLPREA